MLNRVAFVLFVLIGTILPINTLLLKVLWEDFGCLMGMPKRCVRFMVRIDFPIQPAQNFTIK